MNRGVFIIVGIMVAASPAYCATPGETFKQAEQNGLLAREGLERCDRFVRGWLAEADPKTGLIPRNLRDRYWNAKDAAADNYPFMVLTAAFTDRALFEGRMREMLDTEIKLTSRLGPLPDTYDFDKQAFRTAKPDLNSILFGSSEYIKDGLLPLTEWLGPSPWYDRMMSILDAMWARAPVKTPYGKIVSTNVEVNGEMLQALSRVYWQTGDKKYLDWAVRLGDYYLLGDHHPTRDHKQLRLRDHGCEIVSGLCELYAAVHFARPVKKKAYHKPIHLMLDRILKVGRNEHGLFYNVINPQTGEILNKGIADTWGYTFNGYYIVYQLDKTEAYKSAMLKAMSCLDEHYRNYPWEGKSHDGYADSIESAINLLNREFEASCARWVDSEMKVMWGMQQDNGIIGGWHGDGNFARTVIMYCLWKSQGLSIQPWRKDVSLGAVCSNRILSIHIASKDPWQGRVLFDVPRHRVVLKLPMDWTRINQFPEWFTVEEDKKYTIADLANPRVQVYKGQDLQKGLPVTLEAGQALKMIVTTQ